MSSTGRSRRVDHDGVGRLDERRWCAALVARVTLGDRRRHLLVVEVGDLLVAPPRPHLGDGGEVDLQLGVGEDDRADVAALDHPAAVRLGPRTLTPAHLGAHPGLAATMLTARVTSGPRISMVASTPSTITRRCR